LGNPPLRRWTTSYNDQFRDPKKELEDFKKGCEAVRNGVVDNHILDSIEDEYGLIIESSEDEENID